MITDNFSLTPDFTRVHNPYCNCFECGTNFVDGVINNHVESNTTPGYYIGSTLIAKKYITSYTLPKSQPNGNPVGDVKNKFSPGDVVGKVLSYVVDPSTNLVWWQLDNGGGWVQHFPGYYDPQIAGTTSSGKEFNDEMASNDQLNFNPSAIVKQIGDNILSIPYLKWIIVAVVAVVLLGVFLRIKG